jgi:hypothetical protein
MEKDIKHCSGGAKGMDVGFDDSGNQENAMRSLYRTQWLS